MSGTLFDSVHLLNASQNDKNTFTGQYLNDSGTDFDSQSQSILIRQSSKAKTSEPKSALTFSVKKSTQVIGTRSEAFRGDYGKPSVMHKYTVFWTNKRENSKQYKLVIELPHLETVLEAIRDIIPYLNQKLGEENSNYILSTDATLFEIFIAKKSGLPKVDFPALDANQVISQTGIKNICLVESSIRAVTLKNAPVPSDKSKSSRTSMVSQTMPDPRAPTAVQSIVEDEYVEETVCLCFTSKKIIRRNNDDLKTKLLS